MTSSATKCTLSSVIAVMLYGAALSAYAAGGKVQSLSVKPDIVKVGEYATATATIISNAASSNILCNLSFSVTDQQGTMVYTQNPVKAQADGSQATVKISFKVNKVGPHTVKAGPGNATSQAGTCEGSTSASTNVIAAPPSPFAPAQVVSSTPLAPTPALHCPNGYEVTGAWTPKGEIKCRKLPAPCPAYFDGSVDSNTGKLTCTPKPGVCPTGWQGEMQGGILQCSSIPQPNLPCPSATATWKWGTTYYKEGWRFMGCSANLEPAK
jgi:hypothetical protein